jgi:phosphopantetheine--protein transferase-like protein
LAARFAAKEACLKVLRPAGAVPWRCIEIETDEDGAPRLVLHGAAADAARAAGVRALAVSLTHERHLAAAVVAATLVGVESHG